VGLIFLPLVRVAGSCMTRISEATDVALVTGATGVSLSVESASTALPDLERQLGRGTDRDGRRVHAPGDIVATIGSPNGM
jgi:hypothetical protein